jgi:hypothetical protein
LPGLHAIKLGILELPDQLGTKHIEESRVWVERTSKGKRSEGEKALQYFSLPLCSWILGFIRHSGWGWADWERLPSASVLDRRHPLK